MQIGKIVWLKTKTFAKRFAPVDAPQEADHQAYFVMRDGVPDLCCEQHRFYPQEH